MKTWKGFFPQFKNKWVFSAYPCPATSSIKNSHNIAGKESFSLGVPYQHVWIEAPLEWARNIYFARFNTSIQPVWNYEHPECYYKGTIEEVTRLIRGCWCNHELWKKKSKDILINVVDLYPYESQYSKNREDDPYKQGVSFRKYISFKDYCNYYNPIIISQKKIGYEEITNPNKILNDKIEQIKKSFITIKKRIGGWATDDDIENFRFFLKMNKLNWMGGTIKTKYSQEKVLKLIKNKKLDFLLISTIFNMSIDKGKLTKEENVILDNIKIEKKL